MGPVMRSLMLIGIALSPAMLDTGTAAFAGNQNQGEYSQTLAWPKGLPVYDHVVILIEENKDYDQIIGNRSAPYINGVLMAEGASLTQMYGEEHYSQGNYFWLFCGGNLDIGFDDKIPSTSFQVSNLAQQLRKKGLTFNGYSEDLPWIGSKVEYVDEGREHIYGRKHVPWISFGNVPNGSTAETSCNLRWKDFPTDRARYNDLAKVSIVIPNLRNDMHNGPNEASIPLGDSWLARNIDPYYQWAKTHNSLLIVTFDESDDKSDYFGLTNPAVQPTDPLRKDLQNRIATFFCGPTSGTAIILKARGSRTSTSCERSRRCTASRNRATNRETPPASASVTTT